MCPVTDTITSTDYWTVGTRETITSAKWNAHAAIWRGHLLPVDGSTSAAVTNAYDLGSTTYKWRNQYLAGNAIIGGNIELTGRLKQTISSTSGAFSFGSQHMVLLDANSAAFTVTLGAANVNTGTSIVLKKTDTTYNLITIDGNGSETINGTTTVYLATQNEALYLACDGSSWYVKHRYIDTSTKTWTPTGTWSTNVTWDGRITREGNYALFQIHGFLGGGVTNASLLMSLPSGISMDTTKLAAATGGSPGDDRTPLGDILIRDNGSTSYVGIVAFSATNTVACLVGDAAATYLRVASIAQAIPMTWAINDQIGMTFKVPILNWEA